MNDCLLWWAIPQVLAGTCMPLLHPGRRESESRLDDFADDLSLIHEAGIRAIVPLVDFSQLEKIYSDAGFIVHAMPIVDGDAPTRNQFDDFLRFMGQQRSMGNAVAIHCVAGRGRTGTVIAGYLVSLGSTPDAAIVRVRELQPGAIETSSQENFLRDLPRWLDPSASN